MRGKVENKGVAVCAVDRMGILLIVEVLAKYCDLDV